MQEKYIFDRYSRILDAYASEDLPHNPRRIFALAADFAKLIRDFNAHPLALRLSQPVIEGYCAMWEANQKTATL